MSILPNNFPVCVCLHPSQHKLIFRPLWKKKPLPSIPSSLCPAKFGPKDLHSRGGTLLFRRFLPRRRSDSSFFLVGLILGLNQPFCPHIWRWAGSGVRLGNDGIQSTELDEQIILHREYLYPKGDSKKSLCLTLSKFVMIVQYQQPINLDDVLGWHDKLKDVHNTFSLRGPITNFETLFYN